MKIPVNGVKVVVETSDNESVACLVVIIGPLTVLKVPVKVVVEASDNVSVACLVVIISISVLGVEVVVGDSDDVILVASSVVAGVAVGGGDHEYIAMILKH